VYSFVGDETKARGSLRMKQNDVVGIITSIRQANGILAILDQEKNNPKTTLGEVFEKFQKDFGCHPSQDGFAFFNQNQFITSLLAYVCLPSSLFYKDLPKSKISELPNGWGTKKLVCQEIGLQELIRRMRNAVAHGDIAVNPSLTFSFNSTSKDPIEFDAHSIQRFCQALAYWCITKDPTLSGIHNK
jgi:hypothetical protein